MQPSTSGTVRQVSARPDARALSTLSRVDYEDAFVVDVGTPQVRTGEQWARAIVEGAPSSVRARLWMGWSALGLKLASPRSDGHVLGWEVRRSTADVALLGAGSRIGMHAELLVKREPQALLFATFVQKQTPLARAVWAAIEPLHRRVVPRVLRGASLANQHRGDRHAGIPRSG
jgi:Protein of unknown function (DUF2867)